MKGNFGTMLTIDFEVELDKLNDKEHITSFLKELIEDLKMEIHEIEGGSHDESGRLIMVPALLIDTWAAKDMPFTFGTSVVILISASSIQLHSAVDMHDKTKGVIYLDVFSCKDVTKEQAQKSIDKYWGKPTIKRWMLIER